MFELHFSTDNYAFEGEDRDYEISRILREVADSNFDRTQGKIFDFNGNSIGEWKLS